jgi:hypothetical protein
MIYDIIFFKLIFLNKLSKNRLGNLRVSSRFCGGQIQEFAGEFRLRVSSLNLQANLINFAG